MNRIHQQSSERVQPPEQGRQPPLSGASWATKSETYATLISEHLTRHTVWLDAGCGGRLLEQDLDPLEDWLVSQCGRVIGLDPVVKAHRNIRLLVRGSLYALPFEDGSFDLITANMVAEHLDDPAGAFAEIGRCLASDGVLIIKTPNLLNYAVLGNAVASRMLPEKWRLGLVSGSDQRSTQEFFPVRYKANTRRSLTRLLLRAGLRVHKAIPLRQRQPFSKRAARFERILMRVTPISGLLVCAHKRAAKQPMLVVGPEKPRARFGE
jgi:SAM-dependent methyltransferase